MADNELITKADVKALIRSGVATETYSDQDYVCELIDYLEPVDSVPVRHGHIDIKVINPYDGEDCYCSECGHWSLLPDYKWCPYCGVKFDAGEDFCEIGGGGNADGETPLSAEWKNELRPAQADIDDAYYEYGRKHQEGKR